MKLCISNLAWNNNEPLNENIKIYFDYKSEWESKVCILEWKTHIYLEQTDKQRNNLLEATKKLFLPLHL